MRRFHLVRRLDHSGVSGTGIVAEGIQWTDGSVVIRWLSDVASTAVWDDLDTMLTVHGHGGDTKVVWVD